MFVLTNVSQDTDGSVYTGQLTTFRTESEALESAKRQLADDFGLSAEDVEYKAQCNAHVISMSQDGRFEAYVIGELPGIDITGVKTYETSIPLQGGGRLVAYTSESDYDTRQAGIMFYDTEGNPLDLALAEVKRGELAEVSGKDPDNEDIDLMVWGDAYSESYTEEITLPKSDIDDALETKKLSFYSKEFPYKYTSDLKYWSNSCGDLHHFGEYDIEEKDLPKELRPAYRMFEENPNGLNLYLANFKDTNGMLLVAEYHELTPEGKPGELYNFDYAKKLAELLVGKFPRYDVILAEKLGFPGYDGIDFATELGLFIPTKVLNRAGLKEAEKFFGNIAYNG